MKAKSLIAGLWAVLAGTVAWAAVVKPAEAPVWKGAEKGVWTMDYTAALKAAKTDGAYTLMLYTGSWWCPWCQPLEAKVFDTPVWKDYARTRGFYEIQMDYPRRDGSGSCWLYDEDYCKAAGLTEKTANAAIVDRLKKQGSYALADAATATATIGSTTVTYKRIGYPTILVLRPNGTVAGRFSPDYVAGEHLLPEEALEPAEAFAAVTNDIEQIIALSDTHVRTAVYEGCEGKGTVTAFDKVVETGAKVSIKAKAEKGYCFAGWYLNGFPAETLSDYRTANNSYVTVGGEAVLEARFVAASEDFLSFDLSQDVFWFDQEEDVLIPLEIASESAPTITVSGLPGGLKFDKNTLTISGTTKAEDKVYYVTVTGKNASGYKYSQVFKCEVGFPDEPEPTPLDDYLDFSVFEGLAAGDSIWQGYPIAWADEEEGVVSISGLPSGLVCETETDESGFRLFLLSGTPTKAGLQDVTVKGACYDEDRERYVTVTEKRPVIIAAAESAYASAAATEGGKVSGEGVYAAGETVTITAKADKDFVFAHWESDGSEFVGNGMWDPRDPNFSQILGSEGWFPLTATFVSKKADLEKGVVIEPPAGTNELDATMSCEFAFMVDSLSLPAVKVNGLPKGVTYATAPDEEGNYRISFDPAQAKQTPFPGLYQVRISASNVSKASDEQVFWIRVLDWNDPEIDLDDSYGPCDPGMPIEPIDLSDAIGFGEGETLKVTGLPKGLTYNEKANAAKGIAAHTITGTPTVPGEVTVTFTAKLLNCDPEDVKKTYREAVATRSFIVKEFPALTVKIDDDAAAAGNKVTGGGNYMAGKSVTLKAVATKGYVFAGWEGLDEELPEAFDRLSPSVKITTGAEDRTVKANFITLADDELWLAEYEHEGSKTVVLKLNEDVDVAGFGELVRDLVSSMSLPSLSAKGLPTGLKLGKDSLLSGKPTKSGIYYATLTAKNAGGYSYVRVLRFAVLNADGSMPEEPPPVDGAHVDLSVLDLLTSGLDVGSQCVFTAPCGESAVTKVAVSGLPKGIETLVTYDGDGSAQVICSGMPTEAGRMKVTVSVTYANRKTAKTERFIIVEDGEGSYLEVISEDPDRGTVTGAGVYAAGQTAKIVAKPAKNFVFAGWYWNDVPEGPFEDPWTAGGDYRQTTLSFPKAAACNQYVLGRFVSATDDAVVTIIPERETWTIDPASNSALVVGVESKSLPTLTVSGAPKGISADAKGMVLSYSVADKEKLVPGVYAVKLNASNVSKAKAAQVEIEVVVPNRTSKYIDDLDPARDAYPLQAGARIGIEQIAPTWDESLTMKVSGLPKGLVWDAANGFVVGAPTSEGTFTVTFAVSGTVNGAKVSDSATITLTVAPMPEEMVGNFTGVVRADSYVIGEDDEIDDPQAGEICGALTLTVKKTGDISAKIVRPTGTYSFTAKSWDSIVFEDGKYMASVAFDAAKDGSVLRLSFESSSYIAEELITGDFTEEPSNRRKFKLGARRNSFEGDPGEMYADALKKIAGTYLFKTPVEVRPAEEYALFCGYELDQTLVKSKAAMSVTIDSKGGCRFSGKVDGKSVSGSAPLQIFPDDEIGMLCVLKWDAESVLRLDLRFEKEVGSDNWAMCEFEIGEREMTGLGASIFVSDCQECKD